MEIALIACLNGTLHSFRYHLRQFSSSSNGSHFLLFTILYGGLQIWQFYIICKVLKMRFYSAFCHHVETIVYFVYSWLFQSGTGILVLAWFESFILDVNFSYKNVVIVWLQLLQAKLTLNIFECFVVSCRQNLPYMVLTVLVCLSCKVLFCLSCKVYLYGLTVLFYPSSKVHLR